MVMGLQIASFGGENPKRQRKKRDYWCEWKVSDSSSSDDTDNKSRKSSNS